MKSKDLIALLEKNGWVFRNVKGSHHIYTHFKLPGHICVPHPKKDLGIGLITKLLKQAGLK
ncbi:type II toxin-antitoxin system HicA family toxin [Alcaligenaceae bacterium]|nr:type II toxin-antitoxin system HicA family toxin [Alcaligenaceae bacterium]